MNNLKIKSIRAKNFLCFGDEEIHIDFANMGNIILIRGRNLDIFAASEEERTSSNGVGKSSIADAIVYGLYGQPIKNPKKIGVNDVINNQNKKKLEVEILVDDYRILRKRKPDSLQIWKSSEGIWNKDTELTKGKDTQSFIESQIVKMTYEAFLNLVIFTDNNSGMFLECTTPKKREVVESFLSLQRYCQLCEEAKTRKNAALAAVKDCVKDLENATSNQENAARRINQIIEQEKTWKNNKNLEYNNLLIKMKNKQAELGSTAHGTAILAWEQAQERIKEINLLLPDKQSKLETFRMAMDDARRKLDAIRTQRDTLANEISSLNTDVTNIKNLIRTKESFVADMDAGRCKYCNKTDENAIDEAKLVIADKTAKLSELEPVLTSKQELKAKVDANYNTIEPMVTAGDKKLTAANNEINLLQTEYGNLCKIEKPEITTNDQVIREQLIELKNQIDQKQTEMNGPSPYVEMMTTAIKEKDDLILLVEEKKKACVEANEVLPYYEFWMKGFGEKGIRKFIMDDIIDPLNSEVNHWLQFLFDGKIQCQFNNQLEETIQRNPADGDPFIYYAMSGGERRKLNLAVSGAFAYITMLNSGVSPSMVFLDEVTTNVDPAGVMGIYKMILELSKEKQVLITTHDQGLLELLEGSETINLQKEGGFTTISNN